MTEHQTFEIIDRIVRSTGLRYNDLAVAAGVSNTTTRTMLITGRLPTRSNARQRLEAFARANADARTRGELKFVA